MSPSSQTTDFSSYHTIRLEADHFNLIGDWDGSTLVPVYEKAGLFLVCPKVSAVMVRGEPCGASLQFLTGFSPWWNLSSDFCFIPLWGGQKLLLVSLHFSCCLSIIQCLRRAVEPNVRFWLRFLLLSIPNPETQCSPWTSSGALICFSKSGFAVLGDGMAVLIRATLAYLKSEPPPCWFFTVAARKVYS